MENLEPGVARKSSLRNPFLYSSTLLLAVAIYVAFVMLNRYESRREYDKRSAEEQAEKRREDDRRAVEQLGGDALAIRAFYISPGVVRAGETAQLCYDVANAQTVTLEPPVAEVWPSHTRCFHVVVRKSTNFTLTILGAGGKSVTQSVELKVQ